MGLLDRLQNGIAAGAQTASEAFMTQFKSQVEQERQEALIRAQESSRIRTAEAEAGIQLNTRQKSFEQDEKNSGLLRARKVADEQAVGQVRNTLERGASKNKMADGLAFKKENAKDIAGIERMIAQAQHITDPNIDLVQNGDGTYMRYDKRAGKSLGVLTDPDTSKPFVGAKDVSKATLEVAQSMAKEGIELMKDTETREEGRALIERSRLMLIGGKGVESVAAKSARVFGDGKPKEEAKTQTAAKSPTAQQTGGGLLAQKNSTASAPTQSFNEAGYSTTESTIAGAKRGDKKAKALLQAMLDEGGLTRTERASIKEVLGE